MFDIFHGFLALASKQPQGASKMTQLSKGTCCQA